MKISMDLFVQKLIAERDELNNARVELEMKIQSLNNLIPYYQNYLKTSDEIHEMIGKGKIKKPVIMDVEIQKGKKIVKTKKAEPQINQQTVINLLLEYPEGLTPSEIAEKLKIKNKKLVWAMMPYMFKHKKIAKTEEGKYYIPVRVSEPETESENIELSATVTSE